MQRLQFGHVLAAVDDVGVVVDGVVGVVVPQAEGQSARLLEELADRRLDGGQRRRVVLAVGEDIEQDLEDPILGGRIPLRRQRRVGRLDGRYLGAPVLPRLHDGQEDVGS
jgi:hypothetical protein